MSIGKIHGARAYRLTAKARVALRAPTFPVVVDDHSSRCTCGDCVMRRLQRSGRLAQWARAKRRVSTRASA